MESLLKELCASLEAKVKLLLYRLDSEDWSNAIGLARQMQEEAVCLERYAMKMFNNAPEAAAKAKEELASVAAAKPEPDYKAAWEDFMKHHARAEALLGHGKTPASYCWGKNSLEAALDEVEALRRQIESLRVRNEALHSQHDEMADYIRSMEEWKRKFEDWKTRTDIDGKLVAVKLLDYIIESISISSMKRLRLLQKIVEMSASCEKYAPDSILREYAITDASKEAAHAIAFVRSLRKLIAGEKDENTEGMA